jgi:hypothetical protein
VFDAVFFVSGSFHTEILRDLCLAAFMEMEKIMKSEYKDLLKAFFQVSTPIFIGSTLTAYFNLNTVQDTTTRLLASAGIGLVSAVTGAVGFAAGANVGAAIGETINRIMPGAYAYRNRIIGGLVLAGALSLGAAGVYEGYEHAKPVVLKHSASAACTVAPV